MAENTPDRPLPDSLGDLRLSDKHMRSILDTAMDGIISLNKDQNILLFNRAAEIIFGWRADQVFGRPIDILIPGRFVGQHRNYVEQFGRGVIHSRRMGIQRTVMALHADGHEFPIEASISQMSVDEGRVYTVILRDVTEAVRRRQQVEDQAQMLDQVTDSVSVVDTSGIITFWNQGAQNLFGWTAEEALGKNAADLLFRGDDETMLSVIEQTKLRGFWSGELTKFNREGGAITVDHRRTVFNDEDGKIKGFLCIDIDVTNRKKQDRLALRSQRLESIGTLAGGIAHDLNNVLTPILMGAKLLSSNRATTNRQGVLDTLVASAQRGAELIQQLLAFAGGIQGERQPIAIKQIVNETCGLLEHTLPKSIRIETRLADDCPLVLGDATELTQILMNLCINARDAMADGGSLVIQTAEIHFPEHSILPHPEAQHRRYLILRVSDTGCGMTPQVLDRIFDPFFTTKDIGKGTGLGLATVQGIVKSHGGFVLVYSEPNVGSTFAVYLPADTTHESPSSSVTDHETFQSGDNRLILLIDDEPMILQMTKSILEVNGYRVITAPDGIAGVELFQQHQQEVSAVLLDMMMPGIDGFETLVRLLRIDPKVKVIACSGLGTSQREAKAVAAGAKLFLAKPYSDNQVLESLSRVISIDSRCES